MGSIAILSRTCRWSRLPPRQPVVAWPRMSVAPTVAAPMVGYSGALPPRPRSASHDEETEAVVHMVRRKEAWSAENTEVVSLLVGQGRRGGVLVAESKEKSAGSGEASVGGSVTFSTSLRRHWGRGRMTEGVEVCCQRTAATSSTCVAL